MKKKKQEQVSLFEVAKQEAELKPIHVKEETKPIVKDSPVKLLTINHYFEAGEQENICRLCGKHGRNEIHGRSRK